VIFVLHARHEERDAAIWRDVATRTLFPDVLFVGCCEDHGCLPRKGDLPFTVIAAVPLMLGRTVAAYDSTGEFIVVDRSLSVAHHLPLISVSEAVVDLNRIQREGR
jgi:hypothetical protein